MKRKVVLTICGMMVLGSLCACGNKSTGANATKKQTVSEESTENKEITEDKADEKNKNKEEKKEAATEKQEPVIETTTEDAKAPTIEVITETNHNTLIEQTTQASTNGDTPQVEVIVDTEASAEINDSNWPESIEIVNAKGDKTTVYHLADGDYMDRVTMRFTYDGNGTWTDTNGVEWSAVAQ